MDRMAPALVSLLLVAALVGLGWGIRRLRLWSRSRRTVADSDIRDLQSDLLDFVKDESYNQGVMVDLHEFWRPRGINREADQLAVMGKLLNARVLLVLRRRGDWTTTVMNWLEDNVFLPVPLEVCLSEREWQRMVNGAQGTTIIHALYQGDHVEGPKVGRDYIGGDRVGRDKTGRDKVGRDSNSVTGSPAIGSNNHESFVSQGVSITTLEELGAELRSLAAQAQSQGETMDVVESLHWASEHAAGPEPSIAEFSARRAILAKAGDWLRDRLNAIVDASSSALAGAWILHLLK